ncbi:MAG TPA: DUF4129 domain-containing protein [Streptosporangiaceae bacterium]|nr:DUF4129 domain-containing protein [Streptosporangiaceae bacterium]
MRHWLGLVAVASAHPTAGGPLIGRREGQRLARKELAEVSFFQRVLNWLGHLLSATSSAVPTGWFGLIVLAVLAVLVITVVVFWIRPARSRRSTAASILTRQVRSAQDYRKAAVRLASESDFARAIVEGVRAIAAELEERAILPPRPARTADELAVEAGRELPALADDLRAVTRLFDDVRYGDRDGTKAGYDLVTKVDGQVQSAARRDGGGARPAVAAVGVPR